MDNIQLTIKSYMKNHKGQAIVMLILIMTVALAIGLSIVQKSLIDVSTSSKVEQSSRAFSAAEAGVEKALQEGVNYSNYPLGNNSNSSFTTNLIPGSTPRPDESKQDALEILNLSKEDVGQVWLADRDNSDLTTNVPNVKYNQSTLDIYWGDATAKNSDGSQDYAALELTLVYYGVPAYGETGSATMYRSHKWYLDSTGSRNPPNGFELVNTCSTCDDIISGTSVKYRNKKTLDGLPSYPILLRARLLYNTTPQPFAVRTTATSCTSTDCLLPAQKTSIDSVGTSGETQRTVNVTQTYKQVPNYFDYAIFSVGSIEK